MSADSPVTALHFINYDPCDLAHVFTFDGNHCIGEFLNHFIFLSFLKYPFDYLYID